MHNADPSGTVLEPPANREQRVRREFEERTTKAEANGNWFRRATNLLLFLAVVFVGDRLVSLGAMKLIQKSKNQFVRMYQGSTAANSLFLGNSRVDRNFDFQKIHEMTGRSCLNLG